MSMLVAFVVALMSSVFSNNAPACKHGAHMHVIWHSKDCQQESRIRQ